MISHCLPIFKDTLPKSYTVSLSVDGDGTCMIILSSIPSKTDFEGRPQTTRLYSMISRLLKRSDFLSLRKIAQTTVFHTMIQMYLKRLGVTCTAVMANTSSSSSYLFNTKNMMMSGITKSSSQSSFTASTVANPWCRIAKIDSETKSISISNPYPTSSTTNADDNVGTVNSDFDLTVSTEWMEYIEHLEQRQNDEGGAGAYDTMRCDVIVSPSKATTCTDTPIRIWGEEYHLKRLENSYKSLIKYQADPTTAENTSLIEEAVEESRSILHALLAEAQLAATTSMKTRQNDGDGTVIQLFRVTLLWSPPSTATNQNKDTSKDYEEKIVVRGHVSCNCKPMTIDLNPNSIVASIAVHHSSGRHRNERGNDGVIEEDSTLPTRFDNPQSKIASWCRLRKKMENPETYKPSGVSEVLMVRKNRSGDDSLGEGLEVLEGLSSNFFVIYKDGTLRTANEVVLYGYVRHLVLECASKCNLKVDLSKPVLLEELDQWEEAFITSSSRLIYPLSSILIPEEDLNEYEPNGAHNTKKFREIWYDKVLKEKASTMNGFDSSSSGLSKRTKTMQKWQQLQREVLKIGGYDI